MNIKISFLLGKFFSTSDLSRLNINGLSRRWIYWMIFSCCCSSLFRSASSTKRSLKSSEDSNRSGIRKFRRDHNSFRVFWSGVPVSKILFLDLDYRRFFDSTLSSFLILWASSRIKYSKLYLFNSAFSLLQVSNVVRITSNCYYLMVLFYSSRSGPDP